MSITGRNSAVISASRWRSDRRIERADIVRASDTGGLLRLGGGGAARRRATGEREEDVVEARAVHREALDRAPARVDLVEQRPDVRGAAVGRDGDRALRAVAAQH